MSDKNFLTAFDPMLAAMDGAFGFLVNDYGFERTEPEQCGREVEVSYRRLPFATLTVTSEFAATPFITVSADSLQPGGAVSNAPLRLLAKQRDPDWAEPVIRHGSVTEPDYRAFFDIYAALLERRFHDLLAAEPTDAEDGDPKGAPGQ